ncbi:MAG: hypothetical protein ABJD97_15145 [Betaproteobacteria bacterium]
MSPTPPSHGEPRPPAHRIKAFRLSDRLIGRARRLVTRRPYLSGSLAVHATLVALLVNLPAFEEGRSLVAAQAEAARAAQRVAKTQSRDLQRRVERMAEIQRQLGAQAVPADAAASSPEALAARAQALSDAIDAADRRERASDLARMTGLTPQEALRTVEAEAAARRLPPPPETAAQKIVRLERQARDTREARRVRAEAQSAGVRVASALAKPSKGATKAAPPPVPASGGTGQTHVADGIPRSMAEQFKSMVRLGGPQGRVGVVGTEGGLSVNREHVKGVAGGRNATEADFGNDSRIAARKRAGVLEGAQGAPRAAGDHGQGRAASGTEAPGADALARLGGAAAARAPGSSLDLTGNAEDGRHDFVRYASPPHVDTSTLHTAAGRVLGPGGTYATRVYLDTWYVIGPFAGKGEESMQAVYPPEEGVDLDGAYAGLGGRTLAWKFTSRGFYPFVPPDRAEEAVYYAFTELRVDADRDVWFAIASDDDSMMWLDDRLVWVSAPGDKPWYHPPYYARDELVGSLALAEGQRRVHLAPGVHRLLFKLHSVHERTFFSVVVSP